MTAYDHRSIKAAQERLAASRREADHKSKARKIGLFVGLWLGLSFVSRVIVLAAAVHYLWGAL